MLPKKIHTYIIGILVFLMFLFFTTSKAESAPVPAPTEGTLNTLLFYANVVKQRRNEITGLANLMRIEALAKLQISRQRFDKCALLHAPGPGEDWTSEDWEVYFRTRMERRIRYSQAFSCQQIKNLFFMNPHSTIKDVFEERCYGHTYCLEITNNLQNPENLPYPPFPCSEDYFCCYE